MTADHASDVALMASGRARRRVGFRQLSRRRIVAG